MSKKKQQTQQKDWWIHAQIPNFYDRQIWGNKQKRIRLHSAFGIWIKAIISDSIKFEMWLQDNTILSKAYSLCWLFPCLYIRTYRQYILIKWQSIYKINFVRMLGLWKTTFFDKFHKGHCHHSDTNEKSFNFKSNNLIPDLQIVSG